MLSKLLQHGGYYIFLGIILMLGFFAIYINASNKSFQLGTVVAATFFYILWGIMHHLINHDLSLKIVIEYILVGTFGLTIIFFLLNIV